MSFVKEFDHLKIPMEDIVLATNKFDLTKVIGRGGFGRVYKGELSSPEGQITFAFKQLDRRLGQGNIEFWKEIMMLSSYKHENLITLKHFCIEGDDMILVYEYASRGSLDRYLSDASTLTWTQRLKICVGAARGLCFLHDPKETNQRVLHRDIKSANILLDENWMAKVSDFGLSKLGPANQVHSYLFSHGVGTPGYCDYSFGVVLLEILCGRLCYEYCNGEQLKILVPRWRQCYEEKKLDEIILPGLKDEMDPGSLESFSAIAYRCVNKAREERPTMGEIVKELEFSLEQQEISEKTVDYSQPAPISDGDDLEDDGLVIDDFQTQAGGTSGFPMRSHAFSQPRQVTTVVLKLRMHCEACAQKIRKCILRMKGVESVEPDLKASRVSVKGTFEALQLVDYLYKRIGNKAVIIKHDPEMKTEDKGKEEEKDAGEKKEERKANANSNSSNAKKDMEKEEEKDFGGKKEEKKRPTPTGVPKKIRKKKKNKDGSKKKEKNKTNATKDKENGEKEDSSEKEEEKMPTPTTVPKKDKEKEENKKDDENKANGYAEKDKEQEGKKDGDGEGKERAEADSPGAGGGEGGDDTKEVDLSKNEFYYLQQSHELPALQYTTYGLYPPAPQIFSDENPHSCTVM